MAELVAQQSFERCLAYKSLRFAAKEGDLAGASEPSSVVAESAEYWM